MSFQPVTISEWRESLLQQLKLINKLYERIKVLEKQLENCTKT